MATQVVRERDSADVVFPRSFRAGLIVFVVALLLRLLVVLVCAVHPDVPGMSYIFRPLAIEGGDASDYDTLASNLVAGNGYRENEGVSARQPVFPLMLAAIYIVSDQPAVTLAVVYAFLGAITAVLCWWLLAPYAAPRFAFVGGVLAGIDPQSLREMVRVAQEPLMTLLVVVAVVLHVRAGRSHRLPGVAVAGASVALAYLCRSPFLAFVPFGLWWLIWRQGPGLRAGLQMAALYLIGFGLVASPWWVRNAVVGGEAAVLTSSADGIMWRWANGPLARAVWEDPSRGDHEGLGRENLRIYYPQRERELRESRGLSVEEARREATEEAKQWLLRHPGRYPMLAASRFLVMWQLWPTPPPPVLFFGLLWLCYLVSVFGAVRGWRDFPEARLFVAVILTFVLVHVATHAIPRYRFSAMPFVWLFFAYGLQGVWGRMRHKPGERDEA